MWVKIYSPDVVGVEVVQRAEKKARRARLYYLRLKKHDRGSVQGVLERWEKGRRAVSGSVGGNAGAGMGKGGGQQGRGKGKSGKKGGR